MKTYTITLTENEYLLLESIVADSEVSYTDDDHDYEVGGEMANDLYANIQEKFENA
jgi:hypothetical protein